MNKKAVSLTSISSVLFVWYIYASILGDTVYLAFPDIYDTYLVFQGVLALLFIVSIGIIGIKKHSTTTILFFLVLVAFYVALHFAGVV